MATKIAGKASNPTPGFTVVKRGDGRYAVRKAGKYVNGDKKVEILVSHGLIKAQAKKKVEAPAE
jgi:hypothetical protein